MIAASWQRVKPETARNWRKVGFSREEEDDCDDFENDSSVNALGGVHSNYGKQLGGNEKVPAAEEHLSVGDEVLVFSELTDETIVEEIQGIQAVDEEEEGEERCNEPLLILPQVIESCEAQQNFL